MIESGTGSGLKRRTERRVRRKLCRSIAVQVEVAGSDPVDDTALSLSIYPGPIIVFEREPVDVLICTFSCVIHNFTAHPEIPVLIVRVLNDHGNLRTSLHIPIFDAAFIRVDEDMVLVGAEPDRRHLGGAIRHGGREVEQGLRLLLEEIKEVSWKCHVSPVGLEYRASALLCENLE